MMKGSTKTEPAKYFELQRNLENIRQHREWHLSMAERIGRLLPPMELLAKIKWERSQNESEGVEKSD
jgi:hypothetical protein